MANEPACQRCHGQSSELRGLVEVTLRNVPDAILRQQAAGRFHLTRSPSCAPAAVVAALQPPAPRAQHR
jgi:hypothetical protein